MYKETGSKSQKLWHLINMKSLVAVLQCYLNTRIKQQIVEYSIQENWIHQMVYNICTMLFIQVCHIVSERTTFLTINFTSKLPICTWFDGEWVFQRIQTKHSWEHTYNIFQEIDLFWHYVFTWNKMHVTIIVMVFKWHKYM